MSQYNKTILTNAGLELAKRANAGQAKFEITRAVTSADDWSNKTIQDLEEVTTIPNIMQQGTIMDTDEVESNNSVIGVSLCFTNKNLSTGYQIRIIGLYVKEEGQDKDFLYAVTTAVAPEYMPDFSDEVLYRFNTQMYLVIGNAQSVNVVINEGTAVTHGQFDKYKAEVTGNLKTLENTHKEDMSHVAKSASVNGGAEILPNEAGKLELVVPDPDLSNYVSLEQLTETLKNKADITAIPDKTATEEGIKQAKELAQEADTKAQNALDNKADKTTVEENLATKANQSDLDQTNAEVAKKANSEDVSTDISNLQSQINSKTSGTIITAYDIASKTPTKKTDSYNNKWLVDQNVLSQFADAINNINGAWNRYTHNDGLDLLTLWGQYGIHYCLNPNITNAPDWFTDKRGTAFVFTFDNNSQTMIYASCTGYGLAYYNKLEGKWHKLATANEIIDLQNKLAQYTVDYNNNYVHDTTIDFNSYLHETRTIKVANVKANNGPLANTATIWGWITTYHWDDNSVTQEYRDAGGEVFWRATSASASRQWTWHKYAKQEDIDNQQRQINDLINNINYIKDNYVEGRRFPASQEAQAEAWENENPQRIAFITK